MKGNCRFPLFNTLSVANAGVPPVWIGFHRSVGREEGGRRQIVVTVSAIGLWTQPNAVAVTFLDNGAPIGLATNAGDLHRTAHRPTGFAGSHVEPAVLQARLLLFFFAVGSVAARSDARRSHMTAVTMTMTPTAPLTTIAPTVGVAGCVTILPTFAGHLSVSSG